MIRPDLAYRFPNTGARWTTDEMDRLRALAGQGTDWRRIGLAFGRTGEACRLKALAAGYIVARTRVRQAPLKRRGAACVLS